MLASIVSITVVLENDRVIDIEYIDLVRDGTINLSAVIDGETVRIDCNDIDMKPECKFCHGTGNVGYGGGGYPCSCTE